jgi:hypothetical protein
MTEIKEWTVYCIEEGINVRLWSNEIPTLCPNDHNDRTINNDRTRQVGFISTQQFQIKESFVGFFQSTSIEVDVPASYPGEVFEYDFSYPMDLSVLKIGFYSHANMVGDEINGANEPLTLVGQLTETTPYGSMILNVASALANNENIVKGVEIRLAMLTNPTIYEDVGRIIYVDPVNFTLTIENPLSQEFPIGSLIYITIYTIRDYCIQRGDTFYSFGKKGIGARELPANVINRWIHTNNNGEPKKYHIDLEFYFR